MAILHYLGLRDPFKGIFQQYSPKEAVIELQKSNNPEYNEIIAIIQETEIPEELCQDDILSEISEEFTIEKEGRKKQIFTTKYERNPKLRKEAIQIHGTTCMACGFNFEKMYGERGKDYIEVHHVRPLSSVGKEQNINPETDLIVLCANCHRMVHRKKNAILTLEELRELINNSKQQQLCHFSIYHLFAFLA